MRNEMRPNEKGRLKKTNKMENIELNKYYKQMRKRRSINVQRESMFVDLDHIHANIDAAAFHFSAFVFFVCFFFIR